MAKQCQFEPAEEKSRLIDAIIYGMSIVKAQEKLLQTPKSLTLDQCLSICRHYESLKLHLDTIKPRSVEYLQKRHNKVKGHGRGKTKPSFQAKSPGGDTQSNSRKPGKSTWKCYYCGSNTRHFHRSKCPAWKNLCKKCGFKGHFEQYCGKIPPMLKCQSKTVQEIKTNETNQNTGKIQSEVDIVNMIRSLGLHEHHEAKKDSQLRQHLHVQELNIYHGYPQLPVFKAPVHPTDTGVVWENCQDIMNIETHVATQIKVQPNMVELNVITIHDVESKCALYSYCTITGHAVKVKQDMGTEINVYPLGQGQAMARPQPAHAYSTSALTKHKPQLLYIPTHLYPTQHRLQ